MTTLISAPAAASAAASIGEFIYHFPSGRACDTGGFRDAVWAWVSGWPWLLGVLQAERLGREMSQAFPLTRMREPPASLPVTKGAERAKRVERGRGGGLGAEGSGLWSAVEGRPWAPWNSGRDWHCGWQTASRPWAGTAQRSERSRNGRAGYNGARSQVLSHE